MRPGTKLSWGFWLLVPRADSLSADFEIDVLSVLTLPSLVKLGFLRLVNNSEDDQGL